MAQSIVDSVTVVRRFEVRGDKPRASNHFPLFLQICLISLIFLVGCTSESGPSGAPAGGLLSSRGNHLPVIQQATIVPNPVTLSRPVSVQIEAEDPDRNPLKFRHQWFVNGKPVQGETQPTLAPSFLRRGDRVSATVVASDGQLESNPVQTAAVTVGNTPPEVTNVTIEPAGSDRSRVRAVVESVDVDQDPISYKYRWRRNATVVSEGEESTLDANTFARGDSVTVEVTAYDAGGAGKPKLSVPIALGNSAPMITSRPPNRFEQGVFSYPVQATDDDKDTLKYELTKAPTGMTIDPTTGVISWPVDSDVKGKHSVRVVVQDGQGGSAYQDFDVSLPSSQPAS